MLKLGLPRNMIKCVLYDHLYVSYEILFVMLASPCILLDLRLVHILHIG